MRSVTSPGSLLSELEAELAPDLAEVERILAARVESDLELVKLTSQYLYRSGGKRIRPMLLLLAARAAGSRGGGAPAAPCFGAMVEIMHTATLVHDDIVDDADTRRGQDSLNSLLGNDLTVLIGDFLYIQSMALAVEQRDLRIVSTMCDLTMRMIEGMLLEKARGGILGLTREEHLEILRLKTAYLFCGCGRMGAMIAGAAPEVERALGDACMNLGMAFQVADDLFDFTASAAALGKPVLSDLKGGPSHPPDPPRARTGAAGRPAGGGGTREREADSRVAKGNPRARRAPGRARRGAAGRGRLRGGRPRSARPPRSFALPRRVRGAHRICDLARPLRLPLPSYRHRPGRTPHPERDPGGHRFLERLPAGLLPAPRIPLAALLDSPLFGYGERLFRAGYFWEAHAVWEELWRAARARTPEKEALRAFIQLAGAALKRDLDNPAGRRKLLAAARRSLRRGRRRGRGRGALRKSAGRRRATILKCPSRRPGKTSPFSWWTTKQ